MKQLFLALILSSASSFSQTLPCVLPPVPPVQPSVTIIPLGTDLSKYAFKANTAYQLAKGSWAVNSSITLTASGMSLDFNGDSVAFTPTAGSSSDIIIRAPSISIGNGLVTKAFVFVHSYADKFTMHDIVFSDVVNGPKTAANPTGYLGGTYQVYISDNPQATNNKLQNLTVGYVDTVGIYYTADNMTINNITMAGSYGEYDIRSEVTSTVPATAPNNAVISGVTLHNQINCCGKSVIGIRMAGKNTLIENSLLDGYVNLGQGVSNASTALGSNVNGITLKNNHFTDQRVPQLEIDSGVIAEIDNNIFDTWATTLNVAVAHLSSATLKNNIRHMIPTGTASQKKFVATSSDGVIVESGTITQ